MKCPVCPDATLAMSHRQGIEIDYCPQCRGVWLDRGELDKLIERESRPPQADRHAGAGRDRHYVQEKPHAHHRPHRKESWLSDLFD